MNIYQRINAVRKQIEYVQKDKEVGGKYWAVTHDAVTAQIRNHLIEHGIVIVPRLVSSVVNDSGMKTGKGIPIIRYEAKYEIDFVNVDEPSDRATVPIEAHALDEGDKAPGKAASYATKYATLKLFSIETGEDEEGRMHQGEGMTEKEYADHRTAIESASDSVSLERAWKKAAESCRKHEDKDSYAKLKDLASERGKKLKAAA